MSQNDLSRARIATSFAFMMNGFSVGILVSQLPDYKFHLKISNGALGTALFVLAAGVLSALGPSGRWSAKHGSARIVILGSIAVIVSMPLIGLSFNYISFCLALYLFGYAVALQDVAMNTHAVTLEQRFKRRVLSTFHALYSVGALVGSACGGLMAQLHVKTMIQELLVSALFVIILLYIKSLFLPASSDIQEPREQKKVKRPTIFLVMGLLGMCASIGEGSAGDWGGVLARTTFHTSPFIGTLPYICFSTTMVIGRFLGDRLAHKLGPGRLLFLGGLFAGFGLSIGLLIGGIGGEIFGWIFLGMGMCIVIPMIYSEAGTIAIHKFAGIIAPSEAVATVSGISYFGFVVGPPLMGYISEAITLRWAMLIPAALGLALAVGSRYVIRQEQ
ncbi:MAG TPA: MFS transporter [Candidatus Nanopelagicaceae bacterium]